MHGNNKTEAELGQALAAGVGHVIVDSFDEIDRLERVAAGRPQRVLLRVTPGIQPGHARQDRHRAGGLEVRDPARDACRARSSAARPRGSTWSGLHAHIGSQVFELDVYDTLADVMTAAGDCPVVNMGGGFAVAYTARPAPAARRRLRRRDARARGCRDGVKVLCEPGRSLVANAGVTAYTVGTVKEVPGVRTYVAVDGGMSDNMRPMLYDAVYEAEIADRIGELDAVSLVGMHCESGDVLVHDAAARGPAGRRRAGDPGDRRLRLRDGEQLQRRAAPAGRLLPRRRGPRRRPPRDLRGPHLPRCLSPVRIGLLGRGTVGGAFAELLAERADAVEAATGRRPEISGVLTRERGRLRRDPRALGPDRRADRRDRPGPRLRARRAAGRAARSSPPTSSCSPSTATSSSASPARPACSCASRRRWRG